MWRVYILCFAILCALSPTVKAQKQSGWRWADPYPTGNTLRGVSFYDEMHGTAVGDRGAILTTWDGGTLWHSLNHASYYNLSSVAYATSEIRLAVANEGVIVRSDADVGTWNEVATGLPALASIVFLDQSTGIAAGAGIILRTTDGGIQWNTVHSGTAGLKNLARITSTTVIAVGEAVYKSTDAGATWEELPVAGNDLLALSETEWVVYGGSEDGDGQTTMHWTNDAGAHWVDSTRGWVGGVTKVARLSQDNWLLIGGGRVRAVNRFCLSATYSISTMFAVCASSSTTAIAVGSLEMGGEIMRSTDMGNAWVKIATGRARYVRPKYSKGSCPDGNTLYYTVDSDVLKTTNKGKSSQLLRTTNQSLSGIDFYDALHGVVTGVGGLFLRTSDGGGTWDTLRVPGVSFTTDIAMLDQDRIVVTGASGDVIRVFRSSDRGNNWSSDTLLFNNQINALTLSSTGRLVCVGDFGYKYFSTNGGVTWEKTFGGADSHALRDVAFVDENIVVAVGTGGTILRSTNAGRNWEFVESGTQNPLISVTFLNTTTGFACGLNNTLIVTTDAGLTWHSQTTPSAQGYLRAIALNGESCVLIDDFGRFLYTTSAGLASAEPESQVSSVATGISINSIYPHPIISRQPSTLLLSVPTPGTATVRITDVLGRTLYERQVEFRQSGSVLSFHRSTTLQE